VKRAHIFSVLGGLILAFGINSQLSAKISSETIDARKGVFRLLSADLNEETEYHIITSIQYFRDDSIFNDSTSTKVEGTKSTIGLGYALFPYLHLSGRVAFNSAAREVGALEQTYNLFRFSTAATGTYDLSPHLDLEADRFTVGASLWIDFSRIARFFKGVNIVPTLIASTDWSDQPDVPFRAHLNLGFIPANGGRYFDSDFVITGTGNPAVRDFDRFATRTSTSFAITSGLGVEFPFDPVIPSVEAHMEYVLDAGFSDSPKWVTIGLKGKPFPQKNIELFAAGDIGLSSYSSAAAAEKPETFAVPLWNVVVGFGLSQFGKRAGEIGVDQAEYDKTLGKLRERNELISALKKDLEFNTVTGRVLDAETKKALSGVTISFPEQSEIRASRTDKNGEFRRFFPHLKGARIQFSKDGYQPSSKFYALKPGESVTANIELRKGDTSQLGSLVLNISDQLGGGVAAQVVIRNLQTNETTSASTDSLGKLNLKLPAGRYQIELRARGFQARRDRLMIEPGRAVLRTYTMTSQE
jgi:hypothetical protein